MSDRSQPANVWQPPPGYRQVPSKLEGVTVFAPQPDAPVEQAQPSFKCPNCGGTTRYDVAAGGVACEHCGFTAPTQADRIGQRAKEFEFTLETLRAAEQGWGVLRQELSCNQCGAVLSIPEGTLSITCPFCASNQVNIRKASGDVLRPRFLIPFKIQPETTRQNAREWLGKGWFHPPELAASAVVDRFTGIYLPFWTFDARIFANWRAEVGYERHERYYDHHDKDWKTRTFIDWRWEDGRVELNIDDLLGCGSSQVSRLILERLYPFQLTDLVTYLPDFLAGWQAQAYDIPLNDAWETGKTAMREQAKTACRAAISSSHVRNFSMTADFADEAWRYILLPVYLASYKFEDKVFQVMVNGQTGVVAGQKPVAWWKVWLSAAALLSPGLLLLLAGLPLTLAGGLGLILIIIGLILLVIGGGISFFLFRQALASEAA